MQATLLLCFICLVLCESGHLKSSWSIRGGQTDSGDSLPPKPLIVAVCGGSGSGKTTLTQIIMEKLGPQHCTIIAHDSYYKNFDHLPFEQRANINFDHPSALDSALLVEHLKLLRANKPAEIPVYDFGSHSRRMDSTTIAMPNRVILVDGILIFSEAAGLLDYFDLKIFVDTADDIRLIRRLKRDINERNRSMESVITQYFSTVRPMHSMLVEPSKKHADIIVPSGNGIKEEAVDMVVSRLRDFVKDIV